MADPDQIPEQDRLCGCDHFKNNHVNGQGKCLFAKLQEAYGYPGEPECPCQMFMEDIQKTKASRAKVEDVRKRLANGERVMFP